MIPVFINSLPYFFEVIELEGFFCGFFFPRNAVLYIHIYIFFFLPRNELMIGRKTYLKCAVCLLYLPLEESLVFSGGGGGCCFVFFFFF